MSPPGSPAPIRPLVRTIRADNSATAAGAVYVFTRDQAGLWTQQAYIKASTIDAIAGPGDQFGFSIDLDGNQADASVTQAGAAYLFARDGNGVWSQQTYVKASNTDALDGFGLSVALDGASSVIAAPGEASVATGINGD